MTKEPVQAPPKMYRVEEPVAGMLVGLGLSIGNHLEAMYHHREALKRGDPVMLCFEYIPEEYGPMPDGWFKTATEATADYLRRTEGWQDSMNRRVQEALSMHDRAVQASNA